jgi:hypothetical protein
LQLAYRAMLQAYHTQPTQESIDAAALAWSAAAPSATSTAPASASGSIAAISDTRNTAPLPQPTPHHAPPQNTEGERHETPPSGYHVMVTPSQAATLSHAARTYYAAMHRYQQRVSALPDSTRFAAIRATADLPQLVHQVGAMFPDDTELHDLANMIAEHGQAIYRIFADITITARNKREFFEILLLRAWQDMALSDNSAQQAVQFAMDISGFHIDETVMHDQEDGSPANNQTEGQEGQAAPKPFNLVF